MTGSVKAASALAFDPDALLVRVGRERHRPSFVKLFEYYAPRLKSYFLKHGADEAQAEEIVQNTFVTVWEKAEKYHPEKASASTWIFTIGRNKRIDYLRREKYVTYDTDALDSIESTATAQDAKYADTRTVEHLHAAIDALPADQAELVRMAFLEEKSHGDIARETQLPLGTVKSRIRLAMNKLRHMLKGKKE